jgi:hypothetical protein
VDDKTKFGVVPGSHVHITYEHDELDVEPPTEAKVKAAPKPKAVEKKKVMKKPVVESSSSESESDSEDADIAAQFLAKKKGGGGKKKVEEKDDFDDLVQELEMDVPKTQPKPKVVEKKQKKPKEEEDQLDSLLEELGQDNADGKKKISIIFFIIFLYFRRK